MSVEGFANLDNPRTRRAWQGDLEGFCGFIGLTAVEEFCAVTRVHVLAWRAHLEMIDSMSGFITCPPPLEL